MSIYIKYLNMGFFDIVFDHFHPMKMDRFASWCCNWECVVFESMSTNSSGYTGNDEDE